MRATLILAFVLTGCASGLVTTYYRRGTTQKEYQVDVYACQRDAAPLQNVIRERQMINECMASKGYTSRLERQ